jgi:hypothetical protein
MTCYTVSYNKQAIMRELDAALMASHDSGFRETKIRLSLDGVRNLVDVAQAEGQIIRLPATPKADVLMGAAIAGYKHPRTGEVVPVEVDRELPSGRLEIQGKRA